MAAPTTVQLALRLSPIRQHVFDILLAYATSTACSRLHCNVCNSFTTVTDCFRQLVLTDVGTDAHNHISIRPYS